MKIRNFGSASFCTLEMVKKKLYIFVNIKTQVGWNLLVLISIVCYHDEFAICSEHFQKIFHNFVWKREESRCKIHNFGSGSLRPNSFGSGSLRPNSFVSGSGPLQKGAQPDPLRDGTVLLHFLRENPLNAEGLEGRHLAVWNCSNKSVLDCKNRILHREKKAAALFTQGHFTLGLYHS